MNIELTEEQIQKQLADEATHAPRTFRGRTLRRLLVIPSFRHSPSY